jgi:hypothetical protein
MQEHIQRQESVKTGNIGVSHLCAGGMRNRSTEEARKLACTL